MVEDQQPIERRDLRAALEARTHLGEGYDAELAESFLARVEKDIQARVDLQVTERLNGAKIQTKADSEGRELSFVLGIVSVGVSIPLMAIEAAMLRPDALPAIAITWAGIGVVNWAFNRRRR